MKQIYVASYFRSGYSRFMQFINNILDHPKRETIEKRLEIVKFCDEFGFEATRRAFGKSRSTIYLWKRKLKKAGGKLSALAPGDKTPLTKRQWTVHPFIESFIIQYRAAHPGVDKTTVTSALRAACLGQGIKAVSESTVGRIIHDLKEKGRIPKSTKTSLNGRTGKLVSRESRRPRKKKRRKGFYPVRPGELVEIDTFSIFVDGLKRYLLTAIDLPTRFAFAYIYKSSSSTNARDFLMKLRKVASFRISRVQTDNGHEFEKHFSKACREQHLTHYFNYPPSSPIKCSPGALQSHRAGAVRLLAYRSPG